jgi:hypothetical protein
LIAVNNQPVLVRRSKDGDKPFDLPNVLLWNQSVRVFRRNRRCHTEGTRRIVQDGTIASPARAVDRLQQCRAI